MLEVSQNTSGCHALVQIIKKRPEFTPNFLDTVINFLGHQNEIKMLLFEKSMSCIKDLVTYFGFLQEILPFFKNKLDKKTESDKMVISLLRRCISQTSIPSLYNQPRIRISLTSLMCECWTQYQDLFLGTDNL
jgi:hypothetical protein